jgi:Tfp pilus assembly protein PilN
MSVGVQEPVVTRQRVEWATVPRVNLLPPEIIEGRRFRRTQVKLAVVVGAVLLAGLAATVWSQYQVSVAGSEHEVVQARTEQLRTQAAAYSEVPTVLAQVDAATTAREQAMATDVLWYRFLDELAVATPTSVWLGTLDLSMADGTSTASRDALTESGLGEVVVTGTAKQMPEVASWLTSVSTVRGMDVSRLQSALRKEEAAAAGGSTTSSISFTSAVTITADALSHRYDRKVG